MLNFDKTFLNDKEIARMVSMSPSWVRKQRHLRKKGAPHILTIDPVMIGASPRYSSASIGQWLNALNGGAI